MGRPNQTHERLDALLDGQTGEVTDDLAPLLEAAEALRSELAEFELDPEVADRHLEQVLNSPAPVVPLPVRQRGGGLRRRMAAVALAAALALVPATMASAATNSALPGQALYPAKLAVEQVRLASVRWSPTREAGERTRLAARRLQELDELVKLRIFSQVPPAVRRLDKAVVAAKEAVEEAAEEEGPGSGELAKVAIHFLRVSFATTDELRALQQMADKLPLPLASRSAIVEAVTASDAASQPIMPPPVVPVTTPLTTVGPPPAPPVPTPDSRPEPQPQPQTPTTVTTPPVSNPDPTTTEPTTTVPPPTPTPTTAPPDEETPGAGKSEAGSPSSTIP
jgi:hypothetical protein